MSNSSAVLNAELSRKTSLLGMKLWVIIGLVVGAFIVVIIFMVFLCLGSWRKSKRLMDKIPVVSKEIKEVSSTAEKKGNAAGGYDSSSNNNSARFLASKKYADSEGKLVKDNGDEGSSQLVYGTGSSGYSVFKSSSSHHAIAISLPEISYLGWGYWFTLRDLEIATDCFAKENIVGEGGYGVVYKGQLSNGTLVAVKSLFNNLGQAEKEFTVEVEAIGRVRHKNLVRLLGYCVEGTHRILVYEYVGNGNLEQWLHVSKEQRGVLTWEARMKIIYGTAKALAYLHEAIEPKVVHRDIKSSNILIDEDFNAKVSDFGLAKLLGSGESHVTTRVMGTFGYVAPEYANTGLLNERSDVYSFGILLLEAITGREPVDYNRPPGEVNLVDWLKTLIANGRCEDVVDPNLQVKPPIRALKKALLVALKCIDPNADRRPRMGQVVHMHESEEERKPAGRPVRARAGNPEKPAPRLKQSSSSNSRLSISGCSRMHK